MTDDHYKKPGWFTRNVFNRAVALATRLGVSVWGSRIFGVRGRKTGEVRETPVNLLTHQGQTYLVAPRGITQWVRNLRAAGEGTLRLGRHSESFRGQELPDPEKLDVLRAYCAAGRWKSACSSTASTPTRPTRSCCESLPTIPSSASTPPPRSGIADRPGTRRCRTGQASPRNRSIRARSAITPSSQAFAASHLAAASRPSSVAISVQRSMRNPTMGLSGVGHGFSEDGRSRSASSGPCCCTYRPSRSFQRARARPSSGVAGEQVDARDAEVAALGVGSAECRSACRPRRARGDIVGLGIVVRGRHLRRADRAPDRAARTRSPRRRSRTPAASSWSDLERARVRAVDPRRRRRARARWSATDRRTPGSAACP